MEFVIAHKSEILIALLAISEVLAYVPKIQANSVFQLIVNTLKALKPKPAIEQK